MNFEALVEEIVKLVKGFEGFRARAYKCPAGVWTIGYGETAGVKEGDVWTQEKAEAVLRARIGYFLLMTLRKCPRLYLESSGKQVACTSLAYNIGLGAFGASSVARYTSREMYMEAYKAFRLWRMAGGKVQRGLELRRAVEARIYIR